MQGPLWVGLQGLCFNILMFDKVVLRGGLSRIPETIQLGPYSKDLQLNLRHMKTLRTYLTLVTLVDSQIHFPDSYCAM